MLGIYTPEEMPRIRKAHVIHLLTQKLASSSRTLFSPSDMMEIFTELRMEWGLPRSLTVGKFRKLALERKTVQEVQLTCTYPLHTTRYHSGKFTPYELALSLRPNSYLSHGTAALVHGLTTEPQHFVYVNQEQSPKVQSRALTQAGLNRAFSSKQRESRFIVTHQTTKIMLLSGKHTDRLGVQQITSVHGKSLELTNLERTLIDIAVRPAYAGGTENVLQSYNRAIHKVSVNHLADMLKALDYIYPYYQAVGFYLQRAGQDPKSLTLLKKSSLDFDFFLAHGMKKTKFDSEWRIHYPDNLPELNGSLSFS
jgi:predicted transcriptional regulator of viral defense system